MKTKERIGAVLVTVILLVLIIIVSAIDADYELRSMNNEAVYSCNAYTRICFTR